MFLFHGVIMRNDNHRPAFVCLRLPFHISTSNGVHHYVPMCLCRKGAYCESVKILSTHYSDVKMGTIASQITSPTIFYSTVNLDADKRKHQSSASLAFVRGIHRGPVNSQHKWPVTRRMFRFMTSSCATKTTVLHLSVSAHLFTFSHLMAYIIMCQCVFVAKERIVSR